MNTMRGSSVGLVVAVVLALLAPAGSAQAAELRPEWGSVSAKSGQIKAGCRDYRFRYAVTAPETGDWDLSVSIVGPGGRPLWFGYLYEGANPASGTSTFRLCRSKTKPGRYKLKAVVSVQRSSDVETGRLRTARFRLR
jgi:hypothetical protein